MMIVAAIALSKSVKYSKGNLVFRAGSADPYTHPWDLYLLLKSSSAETTLLGVSLAFISMS